MLGLFKKKKKKGQGDEYLPKLEKDIGKLQTQVAVLTHKVSNLSGLLDRSISSKPIEKPKSKRVYKTSRLKTGPGLFRLVIYFVDNNIPKFKREFHAQSLQQAVEIAKESAGDVYRNGREPVGNITLGRLAHSGKKVAQGQLLIATRKKGEITFIQRTSRRGSLPKVL